MTIRLIHSNDITTNRADIATRYTDIFFDDVTNSILLPDPTGLLETKIGATGSSVAQFPGYKGVTGLILTIQVITVPTIGPVIH